MENNSRNQREDGRSENPYHNYNNNFEKRPHYNQRERSNSRTNLQRKFNDGPNEINYYHKDNGEKNIRQNFNKVNFYFLKFLYHYIYLFL